MDCTKGSYTYHVGTKAVTPLVSSYLLSGLSPAKCQQLTEGSDKRDTH